MTACAVVPEPEKKSRMMASLVFSTNRRRQSSTAYSDLGNGNEWPGMHCASSFDPCQPALCDTLFQIVFGVRFVLPLTSRSIAPPESDNPSITISPDASRFSVPALTDIIDQPDDFLVVFPALSSPLEARCRAVSAAVRHLPSSPLAVSGHIATKPGGHGTDS